jgi:hypothetical protein
MALPFFMHILTEFRGGVPGTKNKQGVYEWVTYRDVPPLFF